MVEISTEETYRDYITNSLFDIRERLTQLHGINDANAMMEDALAGFAVEYLDIEEIQGCVPLHFMESAQPGLAAPAGWPPKSSPSSSNPT